MSLDFDRVKRLHESSNGQDKAEISLHHNAVLSRMSTYKDKPTRANKIDWDAAKEGLVECVDRLWPKYFPSEKVEMEPEVFVKQKEAFEFIKARGCKISSGKFSQDWRAGKVLLQKNKSVLRSDLLAYAATLDVDLQAQAASQDRAIRKDDLEIRERELRVEKLEHEKRKNDTDWIHREKVYEREGALVGTIMGEVRFQIGKAVPAVILLCKGDPLRKIEVTKALEEAVFTAFRDLYESGDVDITFGEEDE